MSHLLRDVGGYEMFERPSLWDALITLGASSGCVIRVVSFDLKRLAIYLNGARSVKELVQPTYLSRPNDCRGYTL